jgi:signal transduction histidine kinase
VRDGVQYFQRVSRKRNVVRKYWFDGAIALLAIVGLIEFAVRDEQSSSPWFAVAAVGTLVFLIVARRRFPFAAPAAYWVVASAVAFVDAVLLPSIQSLFVVGMATAFLLGNLRNGLKAAAGLAVVVAGAFIIVYEIPDHTNAELLFVPLEFAISWLAGFVLRERAEQAEAAEIRAAQAERERDAAARIAVAEERARIARELHDIVAHAVGVMVLQVGAVRHGLPPALEEDRDALRRVEQAGRTALAEMRRLLGAMRRDGDGLELAPQPGLDGLDSLLEDVGRAGLPVRLRVDGDPVPLPRAIDLSAYRIVQEGLTNALKHAHASHADVMVQYGSEAVQLEVRDDGVGVTTSDGLGHGLVGVGERVRIYGGEMTAGTAPEGGFVLSARLPIERSA